MQNLFSSDSLAVKKSRDGNRTRSPHLPEEVYIMTTETNTPTTGTDYSNLGHYDTLNVTTTDNKDIEIRIYGR